MSNYKRINKLIEFIIAHFNDLEKSYYSFIYKGARVICSLDSIYNENELKVIMRSNNNELITLDTSFLPEIYSENLKIAII